MIYLDYNATTPVDPRVTRAMLPWFAEQFGNPSSRDHSFGWDAAEAVEQARDHVAELINASPHEIIFTSGATESINIALKGLVSASPANTRNIITARAEHDAVLQVCAQLERRYQSRVTFLDTDSAGAPNPQQLADGFSDQYGAIIALMLANNEIGTITDIAEVARLCRGAGALLMSDITQAVGKMPVDVHGSGIDLAPFSAHKIYGPKGVGALYVRAGAPTINLEQLIVGGGQERGLRGGTLNVPGIVGFGEACRIAALELAEETERTGALRDKLESAILISVPDTWLNGDPKNRICNTSNIGFRGLEARALIRDMHDIAVSTQAACATAKTGPSHVLKAIGLTDDEAYSCIRFSLGRFTTEEEIDYSISKVITSVRKLRR